jgi:hypothetical protein
VGHPLKDVCASPVNSSESDEGSTEIMNAAYPHPQPLEIVMELVAGVVTTTHLLQPRRDDEVVRRGLVIHDLTPAAELPSCQHGGERWVDGDLPASPALCALPVVGVSDHQATEWLSVLVVVPPSQTADARADPGWASNASEQTLKQATARAVGTSVDYWR